MEKTNCEIWIAINEDGDYEVGTSDTEASERLIENSGGAMIRIVKITAHISPPVMSEAEVDVSDEAGETTEVEAA